MRGFNPLVLELMLKKWICWIHLDLVVRWPLLEGGVQEIQSDLLVAKKLTQSIHVGVLPKFRSFFIQFNHI